MAQILALQAEGVPLARVVADAAYGTSFEFRETLTAQGIPCVLGVREDTTVWSPGVTPREPRGVAVGVAARPLGCMARRVTVPFT